GAVQSQAASALARLRLGCELAPRSKGLNGVTGYLVLGSWLRGYLVTWWWMTRQARSRPGGGTCSPRTATEGGRAAAGIVAARRGGGCFSQRQSQLRGGAPAGLQPPEVHGQVPRHGHDRLLARGPGGLGAFGQEVQPLLHRRILRLEAHQAPRALDQEGAQPR